MAGLPFLSPRGVLAVGRILSNATLFNTILFNAMVSIKMENISHATDGLLKGSSRTSTVDLNLDVIYVILSFISRPDLVHLMSTCRTFNRVGIRHLLNFHVDLDSTRRIESFCAFMVAQAPLRYPLLRQLSLSAFDRPVSSESINQLVEIFTHASRLETLHLTCSDLLNSKRRLQAACSSLTSLKEFRISWNEEPVSWAKDPLCRMVKQMQSPLVKAHLKFFGADGGIGPDPAILLHHSSATLEVLTVHNAAFQSELQFTRVWKLSLHGVDYIPLALVARKFPSLSDLTFSNTYHTSNPSMADHHFRQMNRSVQIAGGGWTLLDRLVGRAIDLYKLGLMCQIRRVKVSIVNSRTHEMVARVLSDCRPSHVHIILDRIFPCVLCLPDEVAARLTYLRCTINLADFNGISIALDTFQSLLQRSPLTHFMLKLNMRASKITQDVRLVQKFRPEVFASQIIASHPSIRYIVIKVNYNKPLFWKMTTTESGEIVVDKTPEEDISLVMDF